MSKLVMTPGEILRDYNEAKDKRAQIQILAELNATSKEEIMAVLKAGGIDGRTLPHPQVSRPKKKITLSPPEPPKMATVAAEHLDLLISALVCYRRQTELELEKAIAQADSTVRQIDEVMNRIRSEV